MTLKQIGTVLFMLFGIAIAVFLTYVKWSHYFGTEL